MKKILIVDDQSFIRTILKSHLEKLSEVSTIEAANGNEAMGKARVVKPDLILLDIVMPNKDGFEFLKELRENPDTATTPVIIVISHADSEKVAQAKALGAVEFIDKANLQTTDFVALAQQYMGV